MYKSSIQRIPASRANGARSRGPRTQDGKARSSQNAIRRGLRAECVVMAGESRPGFDALLPQHLAHFAPPGGVDQGHIEEMTAAWRLPWGASAPPRTDGRRPTDLKYRLCRPDVGTGFPKFWSHSTVQQDGTLPAWDASYNKIRSSEQGHHPKQGFI